MKNNEKEYISLQEATKFCNYSQEYLSLRARQGKLKAIKFGRNWVTKKEWLEEYLKKVEEYKNQIALKKFKQVEPPKELEKVIEPEKCPEVRPLDTPALRVGLVALVLAFLVVGIVFGQESFRNVFEDLGPYLSNLQRDFKEGMAVVIQNSKFKIQNLSQRAEFYTYILAEVPKSTAELFKDYLSWLGETITSTFRKIAQTYFAVNDWLEEKLTQGFQAISQPFIRAYNFLTKPWRLREVPEKVVTEKVIEREIPKEVEVERITKIEPIREITKITEITKIDDQELAKIKKELSFFAGWKGDIENLREITKKLQAYPPGIQVPTAPLIIGYQGLQVLGTGQFSSLDVSGSAGIQNLGVGGSATIGSTPFDKLTVNASSLFGALAIFQEGIKVGGSALTIDKFGNLTTTGNIALTDGGSLNVSGDVTISGTLTTAGTTSLTGPLTLTSTTTPQLSLRYDGGKYLTFAVDNTGTSTIYSTGNIIFDAESGEIRTSDNFVDVGGATVRAVGERVFRAAASIYRFGMPAETASTSWVRISKDFPPGTSHPFVSEPQVLAGATRVYRLLINYADDLPTASTSSWRIAKVSDGSTITTFFLPGLNATALDEPRPYLTEELLIPDDDWQIEVKVPAGNKIRIFNIFLLAYDKINQ